VSASGRLRVGTSGYHYPHWRGAFYPPQLPTREWFAWYVERFDTVELNNTFYRLPEARVFDAWHEQAPPGFCFALKFSRYGSHLKRLRTPRATLRRFLARAERLGEQLGPILVQLPPRWRADPARLAAFLAAAPQRHRFAVEFRDPSWLVPAVFDVLQEHGAALCIHDLIEDHPRELTAGWAYLRFHGAGRGGSYAVGALVARARAIRRWLGRGVDVYAYFNNDRAAYAVANATTLRRLVASRPLGRSGAGGGAARSAWGRRRQARRSR
jgi:uncharacterized protein YecE (DUF72 family)